MNAVSMYFNIKKHNLLYKSIRDYANIKLIVTNKKEIGMNTWSAEFKRLMSYDKVNFIMHCLKVGFIFLFLIGLVMPFVVGVNINNGRVSMAGLVGGVFYTLPIAVFLVLYVFMVLSKKTKVADLIFKLSSAVGFITILWGFILFFVGFNPNGVDLGTGMMFMILFNACMWYIVFAEKKVSTFVSKYAKSNVSSQDNRIEASKEE